MTTDDNAVVTKPTINDTDFTPSERETMQRTSLRLHVSSDTVRKVNACKLKRQSHQPLRFYDDRRHDVDSDEIEKEINKSKLKWKEITRREIKRNRTTTWRPAIEAIASSEMTWAGRSSSYRSMPLLPPPWPTTLFLLRFVFVKMQGCMRIRYH